MCYGNLDPKFHHRDIADQFGAAAPWRLPTALVRLLQGARGLLGAASPLSPLRERRGEARDGGVASSPSPSATGRERANGGEALS